MENKRLINLLDCFFANTCSAAEKEELMQLLDSKEHDDSVKAYISKTWGKADLPHQLTDLQSGNILSAIFSSGKPVAAPVHTSVIIKKWYWAAAAILLIGISVTSWFLFPHSIRQQNIVAQNSNSTSNKNDVLPGSTGAMLTLADGSVIVLDSAGEGSLAKQGNTNILKAGGALRYVAQAGQKKVYWLTIPLLRPEKDSFNWCWKMVLKSG